MKLKYILPIALEVTRLEFSLLRYKRMGRICEIAIIISTALLLLGLLSSCTLTVHPDGSRTYGLDAEQAIQILDAK